MVRTLEEVPEGPGALVQAGAGKAGGDLADRRAPDLAGVRAAAAPHRGLFKVSPGNDAPAWPTSMLEVGPTRVHRVDVIDDNRCGFLSLLLSPESYVVEAAGRAFRGPFAE